MPETSNMLSWGFKAMLRSIYLNKSYLKIPNGPCMQQLTYHNKYENPSKQSEIFHCFDLNFYS